MPRIGRAVLPDYPHHIIQRGHNRQMVFVETGDFERYLTTTQERRLRYSEFLRTAIPEGEWSLIREAVQRGQLTGTNRFVAQVETILGKRIENRSRDRPPKVSLVQQ